MKATHATIRLVLKEGADNPQSVDALAVARVSLEGLYTLCLLFEKPRWVDIYLKDGWKKQYVHFLLQREETQKLPRFDEFSKTIAPQNLEMQRRVLGVTAAEQHSIDLEEMGTPLPKGMAAAPIQRFPSPSGVINKLPKDGDKRRMLERLYPEYVYLCTFAHGLPDANFLKQMFNKDSAVRRMFDEKTLSDTFQREIAERAFQISVISIAQSTAELTALYPKNVDLIAATITAWKEMSDAGLLGRTVWALRTKSLLGILG